jgi:hypothetical protein
LDQDETLKQMENQLLKLELIKEEEEASDDPEYY